jgi:hypothetical protein
MKWSEVRSGGGGPGLEPEVILPEQYFGGASGVREMEGEKRLMLAVLQDAIWCFLKYAEAKRPHGRKLFREAAHWIGDTCTEWAFSFESICAVLDLDSEFLRRRLHRVRESLATNSPSPFVRVRLRAARRHQVVAARRRRKRGRTMNRNDGLAPAAC